MAVARESGNSGTAANASSLTISVTVTSGNLMYGATGIRPGGYPATTIDSATYAAAAMTAIAGANSNTCAFRHFRKTAPATGANNLVFNYSNTSNGLTGAGSSFTGVDQTTPISGNTTGASTSGTPSITVTTATDDMVVGGYAKDDAALNSSPATPQGTDTERWDVQVDNSVHGFGNTDIGDPTATISSSTANSTAWAGQACNVEAASATRRRYRLIG